MTTETEVPGRENQVEQTQPGTTRSETVAEPQPSVQAPLTEGARQLTSWEFFSKNAVAITAATISLCSLLSTMYFAVQTRRHNRLSVLPNLEQRLDIFDEQVSLVLQNTGIGPARITGLEAEVAGHFRRFPSTIDYEELNRLVQDAGLTPIAAPDSRFREVAVGSFIRAGESIVLVELHPPKRSESTSQLVRSLEALDLLVCYTSIYGDRGYTTRVAGESNTQSCRFDGTTSIFGARVRFKWPFSGELDSEDMRGF